MMIVLGSNADVETDRTSGSRRGSRESAPGCRQAGYSLVELLIALVLMTLILAALYTVLFQSQAAFDVQQDAAALIQQARLAADTIATELRMTGNDIGNVADALPVATPNRISFVADIDNGSPAPPCGAAAEGAANGGAERVEYRLTGANLVRTIDCWNGGGWANEFTDQVMVRDVVPGMVLFRYFDAAGAEISPGAALTPAQRDRVRVVQILMGLEDAENQVLAETLEGFSLTTQVRLRNRGS